MEAIFNHKKKKFSFDLAAKPKISVPDETITRGTDALYDALHENLMPPVGGFSNVWARPAPKYPAAYLWDSAFMAMALKTWDPIIAMRIMKPFVEFQAVDGRMPHMVFWGKMVSKLSNPPFLEHALSQIAAYHRDIASITFFLPAFLRFVAWRRQHRFNSEHGLYYWIDSYESGIDNTPRFRSVDEKEDYGVHNLGAIDLNTEIAVQHEAIMHLMEISGLTAEIDDVRQELDRITLAIDQKLWDKKRDLFGDLDLTTG
nr:hypothetical protein [Candidatus Sigynarchaeota archaeon]